MNSVETEPEVLSVETLAENAEAQRQMQPRRWSFLGSFKRAAHRFAEWIDRVDVDGQEYWN